jgi:signal transduction histidine kinase
MAASGSAARARPRAERHSIRLTLTAMVALPSAALLVLAGAAAAVLATGTARRSFLYSHRELVAWLLAGASLVAAAIAVALARSFAGRLSADIRDLAGAAAELAAERSPHPAAAPGASVTEITAPVGDAPRARTRSAEIALAEAAIEGLRQAGRAVSAGDASLREGLRRVYVSLARRNQSLLQRQLRLIDALEQKAQDPAALADLFALDHLTTRMRRHAESLAVLSGAAPGRSFRDPVPVVDVIRGAIAEIEDYTRVVSPAVADDAVLGPAAADMMHLLAELIENATLSSPSGTEVEVRAGLVAHGLAVEIDDRGLGIEPARLEELNRLLASPPDFDRADADRLGLFVAARLAARHGARVSLRPSPYGGTTAIVLMPASIVVPASGRSGVTSASPGSRPELAGPAAVSQRAARRLAVAGRLSASAVAWSPAQPTAPAEGSPASAATPGPAAAEPATTAAGHAADALTPGQDAGAYRGLPRRARQASLSPHLKDGGPADRRAQAAAEPAPPELSPDRARDLAAAWQSGWQRERRAEPDASLPDASLPDASLPDASLPNPPCGEEPS